jgi:predicted Zn-ribbon and HTH transcriptional regulator
MKKEDLIKKAAERGITIDETQAEKYINLSDEELENIAGGWGVCSVIRVYSCNKCWHEFEVEYTGTPDKAVTCPKCKSENVSYKRTK